MISRSAAENTIGISSPENQSALENNAIISEAQMLSRHRRTAAPTFRARKSCSDYHASAIPKVPMH